MKDFADVLEGKPENPNIQKMKEHFAQHSEIQQHDVFENPEPPFHERIKNFGLKLVSPFAICLITGPFNTASITLQVTEKDKSGLFEKKIEMAGEKSKLIKTGIFGDNKIFKPQKINGYHDCLTSLGKEGVRGLYKGNFIGALLSLSNAKLRTQFYNQTIRTIEVSDWKTNLVTILTCTLADFLTMPLLLAQSRFTIQNSNPRFRTYTGLLDMVKRVPVRQYWQGSSVLLFKNTLFCYSWLSFIKESPVYSFVLSSVLSHIVTYPFLTVIRNLQCNAPGVAMMHGRSEKVMECGKRIWQKLGVRGFYRGFLGYGLVHIFLGFIMVEMNIRSGYFQQMKI